MADAQQEAALHALREELLAAGAAEVDDFAIAGVGTGTGGSECVRLREDDAGWHVDYRDRGQTSEVLATDDFERAVAFFREEALALAGAHGRGPRAKGGATIPLSELRRQQGWS